MKESIKLDTFEGHLVMICKGHYVGNNDFFEALRSFWAVRCGVTECTGDRFLENVADEMYRIMSKCSPRRMEYFYQVLHRELAQSNYFKTKPEGMSHIQAMVWEYRSFLVHLQIKDTKGGKGITLISLPEPQKQILKRVCNGNGRYEIHFFRGHLSPNDLIELSKTKKFKLSENDADVFEWEGEDMDTSNGCSESCEVF